MFGNENMKDELNHVVTGLQAIRAICKMNRYQKNGMPASDVEGMMANIERQENALKALL